MGEFSTSNGGGLGRPLAGKKIIWRKREGGRRRDAVRSSAHAVQQVGLVWFGLVFGSGFGS